MKLGTFITYLKKTQKYINHRIHPLRVLLTSAFFHHKLANFAISENANTDCILIYTYFLILLTFFESFKIFLINTVTILMMPAILATPDLLKIKIF